MAKGYLVVRAEVPEEADRASFDHWYGSDHLPLAIRTFAAQRGWRCWSRSDPAVHYAFTSLPPSSRRKCCSVPNGSSRSSRILIAYEATGWCAGAKSSKSSRK